MYAIIKQQSLVPKAPRDQFNGYISIPLGMVTVNLWLNGKHGERWYHSSDSVKYKHYEGSLLKNKLFQ